MVVSQPAESAHKLTRLLNLGRPTIRRWRARAKKKYPRLCGLLRSAIIRANPEDFCWYRAEDTFCELVRLGRIALDFLGIRWQLNPPGVIPWLNHLLNRIEAGAWV